MRGALAISVMVLLTNCERGFVDPALVQQVNSLETTMRQRRAEIDALEQRGAQLRAELQQMQERLALAQCQAIRAEVRATAARMVAQCQEQRIHFAQCNADAARQAADNTLMGGLLGLAAAALTGGAAAPFVLGGSVLGRAASDGSGACGAFPTCSVTPADYQQDAMRQHSLTALPQCRDAPQEASRTSSDCFFAMRTGFFLRPVETAANTGPDLPTGTEVRIIRAGTLVRNDRRRAALTRLRDGREGWVFFTEGELRQHQCVPAL